METGLAARLAAALDAALASGELTDAVAGEPRRERQLAAPAEERHHATHSATVAHASPSVASSASARQAACGGCAASLDSPRWLEDALASHTERGKELAQEISAVREATAVGAVALIELRGAVQAQLQALLKQAGTLEQDLAATKLELAEVVIDKENSEANLRSAIEAESLRTRSHFHEMHMTVREALELQVLEVRQAVEKESRDLRQLIEANSLRADAMREQEQLARDSVAQRLEDRLEAGKEETMSYFHKIDKVMHGETSGVMQKLDNLSRAQAGSEESYRRASEELRRVTEDYTGSARRFQELHEKLEPRVFHLEEAQRHSEARVERMQDQVRSLFASRYSSPADESREAAPMCPEDTGTSNVSRNSVCVASLATPAVAPENADDTWRFSHSTAEPATRAQTVSVGSVAGLGADHRASGSSASRARDVPVREGPSRTSGSHAATLQSPQPQQQAIRTAAATTLGSTRSPAKASPPTRR